MRFFGIELNNLLSRNRSLFSFNIVNASTDFNRYRDKQKLAAVLSSPAILKVISLQCDLFSLGKVYVYDDKENEIDDDPFCQRIKRPNPFQSESQFLWDFMFWNMLGTAYCYVDSALVDNEKNKFYFLDPSKIEWPERLQKDRDKLLFSDAKVREQAKTEITYRYSDGSTFKFPLDRLIIMNDLTNGLGNFYQGPNRIDALYKIVSNSEHALDAKNINVRYSGKFLVGNKQSLQSVGLGDIEKRDISDKMDSDKTVWPIGKDINIRRFVSDMVSLGLDQAYLADYFLCGNMYGIPRDVLEAYLSSTYENQEKARMSHVSYCLQPKGNDFMDGFERKFTYDTAKKNIYISWDHLPFVQVFEKERADKEKIKIESLSLLRKEGIPLDQINLFLDTNFDIPEPEKVIEDNADPETLAAQAALRGSVGGVQGILAIQASVSAGTSTRESALSMLTIVYGFSDEDAANLLGEPDEAATQGEINPGTDQGTEAET